MKIPFIPAHGIAFSFSATAQAMNRRARASLLVASIMACLGVSGEGYAQTIGCSTPAANTLYYSAGWGSCSGVAYTVSMTTLEELRKAGTDTTTLACVAATAGMLRYSGGDLELCNGSSWTAVSGGGGGGGGTITTTDRISTTNTTSGATLGMVVADQGTISFTLGGTEGRAYLIDGVNG